MIKCLMCEKPAKWLRVTQFSGEHPFCKEHAKLENDFKVTKSSYFYWTKINRKKNETT